MIVEKRRKMRISLIVHVHARKHEHHRENTIFTRIEIGLI